MSLPRQGERPETPAYPATTISRADWENRRKETNISKQHLDLLVINFLVTEGYTDAAKAFQEEAGLPKELLAAGSEERMHIRNAVEKGAVDEAIERVNDLNPEILEEESKLLFHLQQQQLIELIRTGNVKEALAFAQEYLAYKGEENEALLDELESTIALIAFPQPENCPVKSLMSIEQRQQTASKLNAAILTKYCQESEPRLAGTLKMLLWGQDKLGESVKFPKIELRPGQGHEEGT